jgi:hypothetical protein
MPDRDDDPDAPVDETPDSADATDDPEDVEDGSPRATREQLQAFLALPATLRRAAGIVGKRVPAQDVGDFVGQAVQDALRSTQLPRADRMQAWFDACCRKAVARHYRRRERRKKYEGAMPVAPAVRDEAGEPVEDPGDAVVDIDPSVDPQDADLRAEGTLFRRWMKGAVADDAQDRQTYAAMEAWADADEDAGVTYATVAAAHGMTDAAFKKRVQRLREKYAPRYERWRNRTILLLILGGITLVLAIWALLHRRAPPPAPFNAVTSASTTRPPPVVDDDKNVSHPAP